MSHLLTKMQNIRNSFSNCENLNAKQSDRNLIELLHELNFSELNWAGLTFSQLIWLDWANYSLLVNSHFKATGKPA